MQSFLGQIQLDNTSLRLEKGTWKGDDTPGPGEGGSNPDSGEGGSNPDSGEGGNNPDSGEGGNNPDSGEGGSNPDSGEGGTTSDSTNVKITFDNVSAFPIAEEKFLLSNNTAVNSAASVDGTVKDENGNTVPCWKGNISIVDTDEKYIHIEDIAGDGGNSGQCTEENALAKDVGQAHLKMTKLEGSGDMVVYELRVRVDDLEGCESQGDIYQFDMSIRQGNTRAARLYFYPNRTTGEVELRLDAKGASGTVGSGINVEAGEWFTVRFEYISSGDECDETKFAMRAYVNGTKVIDVSNKSVHTYCPASAVDRADLLIGKNFIGVLDIDYILIQVTDSSNSLANV